MYKLVCPIPSMNICYYPKSQKIKIYKNIKFRFYK